ncbi:hypothetical protein EPN15_05430 [Patescibacteria group bacterium]|nr:MAG: hypothetical protein EPN15_05430 [Patescibacteria group bacterium]
MPSIDNARIYSHYRYILWIFILISLIITIILVFYSLSSAKITVFIPMQSTAISKEFTISANPEKNNSFSIGGEILEEDLSDTLAVRPAKTESKEQILSGSITIINNSSKDQPLVSGTRLLSENGILFRTNKTIAVPARRSVQVEAKADDAAAGPVLAPQKFTIVALWPGLQDKIYGAISDLIIAETEIVRITERGDIDKAKLDLEKILYAKGLAALRAKNIGNLKITDNLIIKEMIDFSHTGIADKAQAEFTAEGKMRLTAIAVDPESVKSALLTGQENMVLSKESIERIADPVLKISSLDLKNDSARIIAKITIPANSPKTDPFIVKSLAGKTPNEIAEYFKRSVYAKEVEVKMSPINLPVLLSPAENIKIDYVPSPL